MIAQHYHIADSNEDSEIKELEIYWNRYSNIVIRDDMNRDDVFFNLIVLTPEMAKNLVDVLQNMLKEDNDQQPK